MPVVKVSLNDALYQELMAKAKQQGISIQDYIRSQLSDQQEFFYPEKAVQMALQKYRPGEQFTLPMVYGDEWKAKRGEAGVFGRRFDQCIARYYSDKIVRENGVLMNRCTVYRVL